MGFQPPVTVFDAISRISCHDYLLPAIQRDYVWKQHQVTWLFDSLMRSYPISSFLFWEVRSKNIHGYKFYRFLERYREDFKISGDEHTLNPNDRFLAILDGQQRLTSLYIGLKGSYAWRVKHGRYEDDSENSRPTRHLYLNISNKLDENDEEDGRIYDFEFKADSETSVTDIYISSNQKKWFRVGKILELANVRLLTDYFAQNNFDNLAKDNIARLHEMVFSEHLINYYLEDGNDLHKALNIFIRINSGATPLSFSDLIMSIAISNWIKLDAKEEFKTLVLGVGKIGFNISKDFVLKTFLFLYSNDIKFKVTNFTSDTALLLEDNWQNIKEAICQTFKLIRSFGFAENTLPSKNALIPIIYYIYHRRIYDNILKAVEFREDRDAIKKWLHIVILNRVFGGSSDSILAKVRKAFTDEVKNPLASNINAFPVMEIKKQIGSDLVVSDEKLEELLITQKDDQYAFSILALLFPHLDYKNNDFHKDHLHPETAFDDSDFISNNIPEADRIFYHDNKWWNSIINLQMLDANENMSKQDKSLSDWIDFEVSRGKDKQLLYQRCYIPNNVDLSFLNFKNFAKGRKSLLIDALRKILI